MQIHAIENSTSHMGSKMVVSLAAAMDALATWFLFADAKVLDISVLSDARRIGICVIGAAIGAFLTIAVFPPDIGAERIVVRRLALKFGSSMLGGIAVTPGLIEWFHWPSSADSLLTISFFVSVFLVSGLHVLAPRVEKLIDKFLSRWSN